MYLVELRDKRIKEFKNKEEAERYAIISNGLLVGKRPPKKVKKRLLQFWERN